MTVQGLNHTQWKHLLTDTVVSVCVTDNCLKNVDVDPRVLRVGYVTNMKSSLVLIGGRWRLPQGTQFGIHVAEFFEALERYAGLEYEITYEAEDWEAEEVSTCISS